MAKTKKSAKTTSKKVENTSKTSLFIHNKMMFSLIISVILIFIAMFYAYDVRSSSVDLEGLNQRVEQNIYSQVQQLILREIQFQYPNVQNQQFLQEETAKRYQGALETGVINFQGQEIVLDELIQAQVEQAKAAFQDENGNTYLTAIDPYHFLGLTENYLKNGHTGTTMIDGQPIVEYKLAPENKVRGTYSPEFHVWISSKIIGEDQGSFTENASKIFTLSAILAALAVIPIFIFTRFFTNNLIALFVSLLLVSVGTYVSRTTAGFVDTDAYNVLFPLLIAASLLGTFLVKGRLLRIILAIFSGFFTGLFMWTWNSAWFFIVFIILSLIGFILYLSILNVRFSKDNTLLSSSVIIFSIYFFSSFIFTFIFTGKYLLTVVYDSLIGSFSGNIGNIGTSSIWPNVFSSVAELNPASFSQIISAVGGEFIFILALIGLVFLILDFKKEDVQIKKTSMLVSIISIIYFVSVISGNMITSFAANSKLIFLALLFLPVALAYLVALFGKNISYKIFISMILTIWMAGTIYMSLNGVRFILLLAPAFAIAAGTGLYYIAQNINNYLVKEFNIKDSIKQQIPGYVVVSIIFALVFSPMYTQAYAIGNSATPNFDDAWYEAMYKIDNETNQNAIITSWWDFGHFFAAVGNRGVTFDGGSQTTPQSHWVGKFLLEGDEDVSVDILRMLTCGGNQAFDTALEISQDPTNGVHINEMLYETFSKTKEEKQEIIANYKYYDFTQEDINSIMQYLHCAEPRENLVITSGDMVGKAGVWAHWGSWDFTKKYVHDNYKKSSTEEIATLLDKNQSLIEQYVKELEVIDLNARTQNVNRENLINQWFAPYPTYGENIGCSLTNTSLVCAEQISVDLITGEISTADSLQFSIRNIVLPSPEDIRVLENDVDGFADLIITQNAQGFQAMVMQAPLGTSLFTKLYYLNGLGTTKFEEFHTTQTQTAGKVSIWKTNFGEVEEENSSLVNSVEYTISGDELQDMINSSGN